MINYDSSSTFQCDIYIYIFFIKTRPFVAIIYILENIYPNDIHWHTKKNVFILTKNERFPLREDLCGLSGVYPYIIHV